MCIFCKIVNREIPADIILESDDFLAFKDINPSAPVHILVIPKTCYKSFEDTPSNVIGEAGAFIKEVTKKLEINESGYRVITNIGENGGQEVKHLHFHILSGARLKWGNFV